MVAICYRCLERFSSAWIGHQWADHVAHVTSRCFDQKRTLLENQFRALPDERAASNPLFVPSILVLL